MRFPASDFFRRKNVAQFLLNFFQKLEFFAVSSCVKRGFRILCISLFFGTVKLMKALAIVFPIFKTLLLLNLKPGANLGRSRLVLPQSGTGLQVLLSVIVSSTFSSILSADTLNFSEYTNYRDETKRLYHLFLEQQLTQLLTTFLWEDLCFIRK